MPTTTENTEIEARVKNIINSLYDNDLRTMAEAKSQAYGLLTGALHAFPIEAQGRPYRFGEIYSTLSRFNIDPIQLLALVIDDVLVNDTFVPMIGGELLWKEVKTDFYPDINARILNVLGDVRNIINMCRTIAERQLAALPAISDDPEGRHFEARARLNRVLGLTQPITIDPTLSIR